MKKFTVNLVDDHYGSYFSIDSADRKEYTVKKRCGLLTRTFNHRWQNRSLELPSAAEAVKHLEKKISLKGYKPPDTGFPFQPGKLIKENQHLLTFLRQCREAAEWKLIFRGNHTRRTITGRSGKERKAVFFHYSVMARLRLKDQRQWLEAGEGSVDAPKFNQDGLVSRLKEMISNHLDKKDVQFRGEVPVILEAGDGGILFHEILGHVLEADYIYQRRSPISLAHIGRRIMPETVTVTTADRQDHFFSGIECDDEGEAIKGVTLVEKGMLRSVIADTFYRHLLGLKSGGFSRTEDFTQLPMPRMYALYLKPGGYEPEELVASTPYGVYAREFGEGKIHFDKGLFYFHIRDARLIEKGKRTAPLGNIVVRGRIMDVLGAVDMVANDFRCDKGNSYCHKNGQTVNVRVGQPTVKINRLYVTKDTDE